MASKSSEAKDHRLRVYGKYGGRCALCGELLGPKWHIWPMVKETGGLRVIDARGVPKDAREHDLPACISCNSSRLHHSRYGSTLITIEQFRACLYQEHEFLANGGMYATYYQRALRFGLIQETHKPIVFYFERETINFAQ